MPRKPRFSLPGYSLHLVQRAYDSAPCFFNDGDRRYYLECLHDSCGRYCCDVHAYVLMLNHVHLLVTPRGNSSTLTVMQALGDSYVQYFNSTYQRRGALWDGRVNKTLVQDDQCLLMSSLYIELAPVRAGIVVRPGDYVWSSYRSNALGEADALLTPHTAYLALGRQISRRRVSYRKLFDDRLPKYTLV